MEKFNPFIRHDVATVCHLQVVFLSAECGLPYAEIAEITGYAVSTVRNYVRKYADDIDLDRVFVTHAGCEPEVVDSVVAAVKQTLPFKEVFVTRAGCTISSHCGANTLGVLFVRKTPLK